MQTDLHKYAQTLQGFAQSDYDTIRERLQEMRNDLKAMEPRGWNSTGGGSDFKLDFEDVRANAEEAIADMLALIKQHWGMS